MEIIILFGPPYSGKGTQGERIASQLNFTHVSTGEILRYEKQKNSPIGNIAQDYTKKGLLAPDDLLETLVERELVNNISKAGIILDGYPRTIAQAETLFKLADKHGIQVAQVVFLEVEKGELVKRGIERSKISNREDDQNPDIIKKRIDVYELETKPVADFYSKYGLVTKILGEGTFDEITTRIINGIKRN